MRKLIPTGFAYVNLHCWALGPQVYVHRGWAYVSLSIGPLVVGLEWMA